jgi:hypothetical protein
VVFARPVTAPLSQTFCAPFPQTEGSKAGSNVKPVSVCDIAHRFAQRLRMALGGRNMVDRSCGRIASPGTVYPAAAMSDVPVPPDPSSTFLLEMLDGRDVEDDPANAVAERQAAKLVRAITQNILSSRQRLTDQPIEALDELMSSSNAGTWLLDDFYCHELLERVPKMVRRTLELSSLAIPAAMLPKSSVHVFYEQAVRCYIFGLWQAAAVLARGTVETALRERVQGTERDKLAQLIALAVRQRALVGPSIQAASVVKLLGDRAVHGEAVRAQDAKKLVTCAREVILTLFGGRMGAESRPA